MMKQICVVLAALAVSWLLPTSVEAQATCTLTGAGSGFTVNESKDFTVNITGGGAGAAYAGSASITGPFTITAGATFAGNLDGAGNATETITVKCTAAGNGTLNANLTAPNGFNCGTLFLSCNTVPALSTGGSIALIALLGILGGWMVLQRQRRPQGGASIGS